MTIYQKKLGEKVLYKNCSKVCPGANGGTLLVLNFEINSFYTNTYNIFVKKLTVNRETTSSCRFPGSMF